MFGSFQRPQGIYQKIDQNQEEKIISRIFTGFFNFKIKKFIENWLFPPEADAPWAQKIEKFNAVLF